MYDTRIEIIGVEFVLCKKGSKVIRLLFSIIIIKWLNKLEKLANLFVIMNYELKAPF